MNTVTQLSAVCEAAVEATDLILAKSTPGYESQDRALVMAHWYALVSDCGRDDESTAIVEACMAGNAKCKTWELAQARVTASERGQWSFEDEPKIAGLVAKFRKELDRYGDSPVVLPPLTGRMALPEKPRAASWLVQGILGRGRVHMLSGQTGSAKSLFREALMCASLTGEQFLGRDVPRLKWMILDGENAREDIEDRWLALGVPDELLADYVHITTREESVKLGTEDGNARFRSAAEAFAPDVVWIDSITRCCKTGITNDDAVRVNDELLTPLADDLNAAVAYSHHHSKAAGNRQASSMASLGGMQWVGQPDLTMTMTKTARPMQEANGAQLLTESRFAFCPDKSGRGGFLTFGEKVPIVVRGVFADEALQSLTFQTADIEPSLVERILAILDDGPLGNTALAERLDMDRTSRSLRSAIEQLTETNELVKNDEKLYERITE